MNNKRKTIKLLYQNVRGLRTKVDTFFNNVLISDSDLIMITESWLHDGIFDAELCDGKYIVFRKDRKSLGGGVMILCRPELQARRRAEWESDDPECMWVTLPAKVTGICNDIHIALTYIPPNTTLPSRISSLIVTINDVHEKYPDDLFLVAGDFNLPCIDWTTGEPKIIKKGCIDVQSAASDLLSLFSYLGLSQYNTIKNASNNTLDLIFSAFPIDVTKSDFTVVPEDLYHPALHVTGTDIFIPLIKPQIRMKYLFKRANYTKLNELLLEQDWSFITNSNNLDDVTNEFYYIVNSLINRYVPKVRCGGTYSYPVWYSKALINLIKEKSKIHAFWKRYHNPQDYLDFSELRKRQKILQEECHRSYIQFAEHKIKLNSRAFWSYVKSKRKNNTSYPQQMTYGDNQLNNPVDICKAFNTFFKHNFSIPTSTSSLSSDTHSQDSLHSNLITNINITAAEALKIMRSLDITKGSGDDSLPPIFFFNCAKSLAFPVALLFNRSFSDGHFPNSWKKARVVPVHKKGSKTAIENYRPISILNVLSKLIERTVHTHIYPIVSSSIPSEQHGFMKGRSTTTNLGVFIDYVAKNMDGGSQVDVMYTDFEKAFDRVDHMILLRKLYELGIRGNLLRWVESYLLNRSQAVVVGGSCSDYVNITSGVPQGSILGPLLYACYLYDVGKCFRHSRFLMYADDTKVFMKINDISDCTKLQADLDRLSEYYKRNQIGVNVSKCNTLSFTRKRQPFQFQYQLCAINIDKVELVRDLGILLDVKLSFSEHVENIINKSFKSLGFIRRVTKPFSDTMCIKQLYFSYVRSILEYSSTVWNPHYLTYINDIEKVQDKFIKYINYKNHYYSKSYSESRVYHNLMSLQKRRSLLDMTFLHGLCTGYIDCPELTGRVLSFSTPKYRTRHTNAKLFAISQASTNYARFSIVNRLQRNYNKEFNTTDIFHSSKSIFRSEIIKVMENGDASVRA